MDFEVLVFDFSDILSLKKWRKGLINDDDLDFLKEKKICPNGLEKKVVAERFIALGAGKNFILTPNGRIADEYNKIIFNMRFKNVPHEKIARCVKKMKATGPGEPSPIVDVTESGYFHIAQGCRVIFTEAMRSMTLKIECGANNIMVFRRETKKQTGDVVFTQSFHLANSYFKSQGATVDNVILETSEKMLPGMFSSGAGRVKSCENFLEGAFSRKWPKQLRCSQLVPRRNPTFHGRSRLSSIF
ncbi:unnamed protein product [Caenorhabditis nigoni]